MQWCQIDSGTTGTALLQRKLWYVMVHNEILPLDQMKSMVLCMVFGSANTGESARCLLQSLPVALEGTILELSLRIRLLLWYLVTGRVGAA